MPKQVSSVAATRTRISCPADRVDLELESIVGDADTGVHECLETHALASLRLEDIYIRVGLLTAGGVYVQPQERRKVVSLFIVRKCFMVQSFI